MGMLVLTPLELGGVYYVKMVTVHIPPRYPGRCLLELFYASALLQKRAEVGSQCCFKCCISLA